MMAPSEIDIAKAMTAPGCPPKTPQRTLCLVCKSEFDSDESTFDEDSLLWVCPCCNRGHTFGQELLPTNDTPSRGGDAMQ